MKTYAASIATALALGLCATDASAIAVTANTSADDLVGSLLSEGINLSGTPTFMGGTAATKSAGTFTAGKTSGIGIDSGVVLTSGNVDLIGNSNTQGGATGMFGGGGDPDLDTLIPTGTTNDATVLEFDFTTTTGDLFFNYVFASEEYNEFIDEFNDVFGFFVDGTNVALAPNGDPVSVNTVNCGNPAGSTGPNCGTYNNNSDGNFAFEYDGFTDVLTAKAMNLGAGEHTIKLAIADAQDSVLDSGVFLAGSSFTTTDPVDNGPPGDDGSPVSVPEPSILALLGAGLLGLAGGTRRRRRN